MNLSLRQELLERALAYGALSAEQADEVERRLSGADPPSLRDALLDLGLPPRKADVIDYPHQLLGLSIGGFRLQRVLGVGGMGAVFLAEQASLRRRVAVKLLDPLLADLSDVSQRFEREARVAARLSHPHVVRPIDFGREGDRFYFAMDYLDGGSVQHRLQRGDRFSEAEALGVARDIAKALVYAAEVGIVHRDIKPANILFDEHGTVTLADLGLALDLQEAATRLTRRDSRIGSPHYLAPEQALGEREVDSRADIYGLGITLFEMLSGELPFTGPTPTSVMDKHLHQPLPDLAPLAPEVSAATRALLARMCEKRPEDRFESPAALLEAIERAIRGASDAPPARPSRVWLGVAAAILCAVVAAFAYWRLRSGGTGAETATVSKDGAPAAVLKQWGRALRESPAAAARAAASGRGPIGPWTRARALRGLLLADGASRAALGRLAATIESQAIRNRRDGGFLGYPYASGTDTIALLDVTAEVGIALALARGRVDAVLDAHLDELLRYLLAVQNPDGSWSLFPVVRPEGALTSSTALGCQAVCALAVALGREAEVAPQATRSARWLAGLFDPRGAVFASNPRARTGFGRSPRGLSERAVLALLEARALARSLGQADDPVVEETLRVYAAAFRESDLRPTTVAWARPGDYNQSRLLDPHQKAGAVRYRWAPYPWRLWLASRLAGEAGLGDAIRAQWREEARRLGDGLAAAPGRKLETWQLADVLFVVRVVAAAPLGRGAPLLADLVRRR